MRSGASGGLAPFVAGRREGARAEVAGALRALLGLDGGAGLVWRSHTPRAPGIGRLDLRVTPPGHAGPPLRVEVGDGAPGANAWLVGPGVWLAADGPMRGRLSPWFAVAEAAWGGRGEEALRATAGRVAEALAAHWRWGEVDDFMFRAVSKGDRGAAVGTLRLGFRCNQRCGMCWQARDWPDVTAEEAFAWLDALAAEGVRSLVITGGEPTLFAALPELVARARRAHGLRVQLQTNAIALRRAGYAEALRDAGVDELFVSFHSADPAVSDAMTGAPGTHARTVAGLRAALAAGLPVRLNAVVERANVAGLAAHARFVVEDLAPGRLARRVRQVIYSHPSLYRDPAVYAANTPPLDLVAPHLVAAVRVLRAARVDVQVGGTCGFPPCALRALPRAIRWDRARDYTAVDVGDRRYGEACGGCAARDRCLGLRAEYVAVHGERGAVPFARLPRRWPWSGG